VEALIGAGRTAEARAINDAWEQLGRKLDRPRLLATAARGRGLITATEGDPVSGRQSCKKHSNTTSAFRHPTSERERCLHSAPRCGALVTVALPGKHSMKRSPSSSNSASRSGRSAPAPSLADWPVENPVTAISPPPSGKSPNLSHKAAPTATSQTRSSSPSALSRPT